MIRSEHPATAEVWAKEAAALIEKATAHAR